MGSAVNWFDEMLLVLDSLDNAVPRIAFLNELPPLSSSFLLLLFIGFFNLFQSTPSSAEAPFVHSIKEGVRKNVR